MSLHSINSSFSISSPNDKASNNVEQSNTATHSGLATAEDKQVKPQQKLNIAIFQAHHDVSISTKNEPLALIYKAAIEGINNELESELGENAIENAYNNGLDISPEATAGRILNFSLGLFSLYQQQHPELSEQDQANKFTEIIGGGIDTGFSEAREILEGLGVLEGEVAENINKTYNIIQDELAAFREKYQIVPNEKLIE